MIASETPVPALGALARGWRQDLAAHVIAVTGSVGKTSTKDLITAMIAPHRTVAASRENFNTEIGLPLEVLAAPQGTEVLVLELAMRGFGQIAELTAICEPDVGVITNIGPVHLEQMGSLEGVAEAKSELLSGMRAGAHRGGALRRAAARAVAARRPRGRHFGPGGDVHFEGSSLKYGVVPDALPTQHVVIAQGEQVELELPFDQAAQPVELIGRAGGRARRSACTRAARSTSASPRCGASAWRPGSASTSSTTATTPTRCPCAPPLTILPRTTPRAAVSRCSVTCSSSGPASASTTARSAPTPPRRASTCS